MILNTNDLSISPAEDSAPGHLTVAATAVSDFIGRVDMRTSAIFNSVYGDNEHFDNASIMFASYNLDRSSFKPLTEILEAGDDNVSIYSHRVRPQIDVLHCVRNNDESLLAVKDITISHPLALRALSDTSARNAMLDLLTSESFSTAITKFLLGNAGRGKIGTKRVSSTGLLHWMTKYVTDKGLGFGDDVNKEDAVLTMCGALTQVLDQFDWLFDTLPMTYITEVSRKIASRTDLRNLYTEGWISQHIPDNARWIVKYSGDNEVQASALRDVVQSSFIALRRALMAADNINRRADDILNAAALAAAMNMGVKMEVKNETLLAFVEASPAISQMAKWSAVVMDCIYGAQLSSGKFALTTRVGDISLLTAFADEFVSAINNHPLIDVLDVGDFLSHIGVENRMLSDANNSVYHTSITGSWMTSKEPRHFTETILSANVYATDVIKENNLFADRTHAAVGKAVAAATTYFHDSSALYTLDYLSDVHDPAAVWAQARHSVSMAAVNTYELRLMALLNFEVVIRYTLVTTDGTTVMSVEDYAFVIPQVTKSVANPFVLFGEEAITKDILVALAFLPEKVARGVSPLFDVVLDLTSAHYNYSSVVDNLKYNVATPMADSIAVSYPVRLSQNQTLTISSDIDVRKYLHYSNVATTYALIGLSFQAELDMLDTMLSVITVPSDYTRGDIAYEDERLKGNALFDITTAFMDDPVCLAFQSALIYDAAAQLTGTVGSWSAALHNITMRLHTGVVAASLPVQLYLGSSDLPKRLVDALSTNRNYRERMLAKVR